jgi:hypothetical protein
MQNSQRITPHLWFVDNAEEAARFYASIFPGSRVDRVTPIPADTPSGSAGSGHGPEVDAPRRHAHALRRLQGAARAVRRNDKPSEVRKTT